MPSPNTILPVFLLIAFAAIVWYGVYKFRRTLWAAVWLASAAVILIAVGVFHFWLNVYYHGTIYLQILRTLLVGYGLLVLVMGSLFALLPKHFPGRPCPKCKYDVTGLAEEGKFTCPECNSLHAFEYIDQKACIICGAGLSGILRTPDIQCWRCNALYVVNAADRALVPPHNESYVRAVRSTGLAAMVDGREIVVVREEF